MLQILFASIMIFILGLLWPEQIINEKKYCYLFMSFKPQKDLKENPQLNTWMGDVM